MAEELDFFGKYSGIFDPQTEEMLALIQWNLDGETVYRLKDKWNVLTDGMADALDNKIIATMSEEFVSVFDDAYRNKRPLTRSNVDEYVVKTGD